MEVNLTTTTTQQTVQKDSFDYESKIAALSFDDRKKYLEKASKLNINDVNSIQQYGSDIASEVSRAGDSLLMQVKADRSVEQIQYINELLTELNSFDDDLQRYTGEHSNSLKRFFYSLPFIKKVATSLDTICNQYHAVAENVDEIAKKITTSKVVAMRDNSTLQQIFENNQTYIEKLRELIIAGKLQDEEISKEITRMEESGEGAIEIQQANNFQVRLRKRIADLQTTEYVFYQDLFQLLALRENNMAIAEKSDNIVNHVIPIWKNQLPIAIIMRNQKASIDAQKKISETTNKLLLKTAADLKMNSIETAKASEESVISIDTLQRTTQDLISTINEVRQIHNTGVNNRKQLESSLKNFSQQIENAIMS